MSVRRLSIGRGRVWNTTLDLREVAPGLYVVTKVSGASDPNCHVWPGDEVTIDDPLTAVCSGCGQSGAMRTGWDPCTICWRPRQPPVETAKGATDGQPPR